MPRARKNMPILEILTYPDPFLKTKAARLSRVDDSVRTLIGNMIDAMYGARGIGLAATQVGADARVIVLDVPDARSEEDEPYRRGKNLVALINPEIIASSGVIIYEEGCLSLPGETADVERAVNVSVKAIDKNNDPVEISAEGLFAIALQHEIDHLDGILFIDRISRLKREFIKRRLKKAKAAAL